MLLPVTVRPENGAATYPLRAVMARGGSGVIHMFCALILIG
jgi:hypothetical protein